MVKLFDKDVSAKDKLYVSLRDDPDLREQKARIEEMWRLFQKYADPHFRQEIALQFHPRFWEMYLTCIFLENRHNVQSNKGAGPDLKVHLSSNKLCWVEAIAPGPGNTDDTVEEPHSDGGWVPDAKIVLRLRSAIETKFQSYNKYIQNKIIQQNDSYVSAINPRKIGFTVADCDPPRIIQAVFPIGTSYVEINTKTRKIVSEGYTSRYELKKISGKSVRTDVFLSDNYIGLSAVAFSNIRAHDFPQEVGSDLMVVHNPKAQNPIPRGWLTLGREYWFENSRIWYKRWKKLDV